MLFRSLTRISVFLSIFEVHIVRAPVAGRIVSSTYVPGAFLNAELDKASEENERRALVIATAGGAEIGVVQIAGAMARRIVCRVKRGDALARGERFGLIMFGSRTDTYLPKGCRVEVKEGQRVKGGETILGRIL